MSMIYAARSTIILLGLMRAQNDEACPPTLTTHAINTCLVDVTRVPFIRRRGTRTPLWRCHGRICRCIKPFPQSHQRPLIVSMVATGTTFLLSGGDAQHGEYR